MSKPYGLKEYKDQPATCRCQSDDKCPHAISAKLPADVLDSIEKVLVPRSVGNADHNEMR
jgi:hypothetical protein